MVFHFSFSLFRTVSGWSNDNVQQLITCKMVKTTKKYKKLRKKNDSFRIYCSFFSSLHFIPFLCFKRNSFLEKFTLPIQSISVSNFICCVRDQLQNINRSRTMTKFKWATTKISNAKTAKLKNIKRVKEWKMEMLKYQNIKSIGENNQTNEENETTMMKKTKEKERRKKRNIYKVEWISIVAITQIENTKIVPTLVQKPFLNSGNAIECRSFDSFDRFFIFSLFSLFCFFFFLYLLYRPHHDHHHHHHRCLLLRLLILFSLFCFSLFVFDVLESIYSFLSFHFYSFAVTYDTTHVVYHSIHFLCVCCPKSIVWNSIRFFSFHFISFSFGIDFDSWHILMIKFCRDDKFTHQSTKTLPKRIKVTTTWEMKREKTQQFPPLAVIVWLKRKPKIKKNYRNNNN